jgi:hypothetical protein
MPANAGLRSARAGNHGQYYGSYEHLFAFLLVELVFAQAYPQRRVIRRCVRAAAETGPDTASPSGTPGSRILALMRWAPALGTRWPILPGRLEVLRRLNCDQARDVSV